MFSFKTPGILKDKICRILKYFITVFLALMKEKKDPFAASSVDKYIFKLFKNP